MADILNSLVTGPRKFSFTDETIIRSGILYHRIKASRSFTLVTGERVRKGDLGGFLEEEKSLSHDGNCWVKDMSRVTCTGHLEDDALLAGGSELDAGSVTGKAYVYNHSCLFLSSVSGNAEVSGSRLVYVSVRDNAKILDSVLENAGRKEDGIGMAKPDKLCIDGNKVIEHNIDLSTGRPVLPTYSVSLRPKDTRLIL